MPLEVGPALPLDEHRHELPDPRRVETAVGLGHGFADHLVRHQRKRLHETVDHPVNGPARHSTLPIRFSRGPERFVTRRPAHRLARRDAGGYVLLHDTYPELCGSHEGPRHILDAINVITQGCYEKCELNLSPLNYGMGLLRRVG